ncbi:unnamed protein product [Rotaria magnacalcarata]|uniref:Tc1-like transposase DDE domain-containing protein n=2 Tax=Rotaria TaxID=231623 RepID=A0A816FM96_9BILA|nr:unnamed protein product [Rotaria magnacalcarata]CAF3629762.1 unnamed protein product [Rotaria socialis]
MGRKKVTTYQKLKVLTLLQAGFSYENIRNQLGVSNGCISNISKKDKLKLPLENRPGQGRKKLTTFKEDRYLLNLMKKDRRKSSRQLASDWNSSHEKSISARTKSFVRRLSSESDKPFNFQPRIQGGGGSISVRGIMTAKGGGPLVFYDGRMNGPTYISIIELVQDNAPCHKSAFSMKWLKKNKINLLDWPAVSPDFNVIENLWDIIDNKLNNYRLNNVNDLQQAILEIWTQISNETCETLVRSMPRRIKKCFCVKGNTSAKY